MVIHFFNMSTTNQEPQPLVIKARGRWGDKIPQMTAVVTAAQGRIWIRVDDPNNLPNWMEMNISMEALLALHDATKLQELADEAESADE